MTLRQTLVMLKREGLSNRTGQEMRSFTEEIRIRGGSARSRVISFTLVVPRSSARKFRR